MGTLDLRCKILKLSFKKDTSSVATVFLTHPQSHQLHTCWTDLLSVDVQTYLEIRGQTQEGLWGLKMNTWLAEAPVHCWWEQGDAWWTRR